jgi:diguanylate cyclase (GGDEF)-like protein/PAS domain S-box-containing protein
MSILLVEEDTDSRELLQQALAASGYDVEMASNGVDALAIARQSLPELIISDIVMPEMDGFAFCREARRDSILRDVPFIFYTATYIDPKDAKLARKLGVDKFVVKPQKIPELLRIIGEALNADKSRPVSNAVYHNNVEDFELYRNRPENKLGRKVRELELERKLLREREEHFRHMVETAQAVPWEMETEGLYFTYVGPQALDLLGYPPERWYEPGFWVSRLHPDDSDAVQRFHRSSDARAGNHEIEFRMFNADGITVWIRSSTNTNDGSAHASRCTGFMFDISQQKDDEERLVRQANFDTLTALPNRALAMDRLAQAVLRHRRGQGVCALLFIDLDQFKKINDTQGHDIGDRFLVQAANRLKACVRDGDTTARLGGDEFLVILTELENATDAEVVAEKILAAFNRPFTVEGHEYFITASIGITLHPVDGVEAQTLLRNADAAMYQAKHDGRNTYRFFTQKMNDRAIKRLDIELQLRRALENDELDVYFHSYHDVATETAVGGEALLRWNNKALGEVSPNDFIPLAEEIGLIVPMGEWMIARVCAQGAQWQQQGLPLRYLSLNVSPRQIRDNNFVKMIADMLAQNSICSDVLMLEVSDQLFMEDIPQIERRLAMLKEIGVKLAIDDFSMNYNVLSYLKGFSFDVLKINHNILQGVPRRVEDVAISSAMIVLAHSLGLKVVGEGVETQSQLDFLRTHNCDMAQGYYFAEPACGDSFIQLLSVAN